MTTTKGDERNHLDTARRLKELENIVARHEAQCANMGHWLRRDNRRLHRLDEAVAALQRSLLAVALLCTGVILVFVAASLSVG